MCKNIYASALFVLLAILVGSNAAYSQALNPGAQTLKGIEGIGVLGEEVSAEAVMDGLKKSELGTNTIQELKSAGIKALTDQQLNSAPGKPTLVISVNTLKHAGDVYSYTVSLSLDQKVFLERNPAMMIESPTWSVLATGACLPEELDASVKAYVKNLVQQFIKDYKSANAGAK
jgi:hypothetical protein